MGEGTQASFHHQTLQHTYAHGGLLLGLITATRFWYPQGSALARYDALALAAVAIQVLLLAFRLETLQEARVILIFHVVGTAMEVFKTGVGSWSYPEPGVLRIGHVPLFTGFMYAAVGSYLFRVWRLFDFRFDNHPGGLILSALSMAIYANFFADHWGIDLRWPLIALAAILFRSTAVYFTVWRVQRRMPLLLSLVLVAFFIWIGENLGTAGHAWVYPNQAHGWTMVSPLKLTSWFLLMLVPTAWSQSACAQGSGTRIRLRSRLVRKRDHAAEPLRTMNDYPSARHGAWKASNPSRNALAAPIR